MIPRWVTASLLVAACAGRGDSPRTSPRDVEPVGVSSTGGDCWPECITENWTNASLAALLVEVERICGIRVFATQDVGGYVSVRVEQATCAETIVALASEAGLKVEVARVETRRGGRTECCVDAFVLSVPDKKRHRVLSAKQLRQLQARREAGVLYPGPAAWTPWSDDASEASTGSTSVRSDYWSTSGRVHVQGYFRRDGTYVRPHTRSRPRK